MVIFNYLCHHKIFNLVFMDIIINSTTISSADYDETAEILTIRFHNGHNYVYNGVPKSVFEEFLSSPSKGKYYNSFIKGRYQ